MFQRSVNETILRNEGLSPSSSGADGCSAQDAPYRMTWWFNFVDPRHSRRLHPELPPKPVVDVSSPFNVLDETHQARRFGTQKVAWGFVSLNEFTGTHEDVPYADSHHTSEIVRLWMAGLNIFQWNQFLSRGMASGGIVGGGPRTRYAWNIALGMSLLRMNIAGLIGVGGYYYSYEYLYTHGPSCFRIRDPFPNAWKRAWDEDQSTYLSRAVASVFPPLGYAFYRGGFKKSMFWFTLTLSASLYYEYARKNILSGSRLFYSYLSNQASDREAGFGSLTPRLKRRVDPDTNRTEAAAQFRYFRITTGELQNTVWENAVHQNIPLHHSGIKLPNPYFNWKKAPQTYNEKPIKVKNDMWELPPVLSARMRAGALDQLKAAPASARAESTSSKKKKKEKKKQLVYRDVGVKKNDKKQTSTGSSSSSTTHKKYFRVQPDRICPTHPLTQLCMNLGFSYAGPPRDSDTDSQPPGTRIRSCDGCDEEKVRTGECSDNNINSTHTKANNNNNNINMKRRGETKKNEEIEERERDEADCQQKLRQAISFVSPVSSSNYKFFFFSFRNLISEEDGHVWPFLHTGKKREKTVLFRSPATNAIILSRTWLPSPSSSLSLFLSLQKKALSIDLCTFSSPFSSPLTTLKPCRTFLLYFRLTRICISIYHIYLSPEAFIMPAPRARSAAAGRPGAAELNRTAVDKIFSEHHTQAKTLAAVSPAPSYDPPSRAALAAAQKRNGSSMADEEYAAVAARLRKQGAAADGAATGDMPRHLLSKYGVEAFTGTTLAGPVQPDWQTTDRRGLQQRGGEFRGHLDVPSHLSQQFELAAEMRMGWTHNADTAKPEEGGILHYDACERPGDPRTSNFAMTLRKAKHEVYIPSAKGAVPPEGAAHPLDRAAHKTRARSAAVLRKAQRALFHREASIARYEQTLPLRRAADPYMQATGPAADARYSVPTEHTLQLLSQRYGGQHPLANAYRQELYRGEPLVRQVLRGDFIDGERAAAGASASPAGIALRSAAGGGAVMGHPPQHNATSAVLAAALGKPPNSTSSVPAGTGSRKNFIVENKRRVRGWSDMNTAERFQGRGVYVQ
eukprot:gene880-509_t